MKKNQQSRRGDEPGENEAERNAEATRRYLEAVALTNQQRKFVMQEVLSKPGAETLPLAEQEFYELCIEESDDVLSRLQGDRHYRTRIKIHSMFGLVSQVRTAVLHLRNPCILIGWALPL